MTLLSSGDSLSVHRKLLEELIEDPSRLGPDFQPIRTLDGDRLVGYKATGSGQAGTELANTLALLDSAKSSGLVPRLDWAFRCHTFDVAVAAGLTSELHLTPETETFLAPCPPRLTTSFGRGRRSLKIVAELHDDGFEAGLPTEAAVAEWRGWGWGLVVTDILSLLMAEGDGFLRRLEGLRPDAVAIDLSRPGRTAGKEQLVAWAKSASVPLHAHGVHSAVALSEARALGAVAARGRLIGMPGALP